ncbi:MAG: rhodanese-like domain-containing protein [Terracidiphilus sp.]
MPESSTPRLLGATQLVQEQQNGALILDTRTAEQFASLHIRGSLQISLVGHFAAWAALLIDREQKLLLVAEDLGDVEEAVSRLSRVGLHLIVGCSIADENKWRDLGIDLASIPVQRTEDIRSSGQSDSTLQLIDVRSRAEWLKGNLPGALSLPLLDIDSNMRTIDPSKQSLIYCHEGLRATTAASILLRKSSAHIGILIDGIEGWLSSGRPLEMP